MNIYQQRILQHYHDPQNTAALSDYDAEGEADNPSCGDYSKAQIKVTDGTLSEIAVESDGCAICIASSSIISEFVRGKSVVQIEQMDAEQVLELLEITLTPSRMRCAVLPLDAIKVALKKLTQ